MKNHRFKMKAKDFFLNHSLIMFDSNLAQQNRLHMYGLKKTSPYLLSITAYFSKASFQVIILSSACYKVYTPRKSKLNSQTIISEILKLKIMQKGVTMMNGKLMEVWIQNHTQNWKYEITC